MKITANIPIKLQGHKTSSAYKYLNFISGYFVCMISCQEKKKKKNPKYWYGSVFLLIISPVITRLHWLSTIYCFLHSVAMMQQHFRAEQHGSLQCRSALRTRVCCLWRDHSTLLPADWVSMDTAKFPKKRCQEFSPCQPFQAFFKWKLTSELKGQASCFHQTPELACTDSHPFFPIQWLCII